MLLWIQISVKLYLYARLPVYLFSTPRLKPTRWRRTRAGRPSTARTSSQPWTRWNLRNLSDLWRTVSQVWAEDILWSDWLIILDNISVWKKGQQEKKEQAARKKASKKDSEPGESKANVAEPEVIEIDWRLSLSKISTLKCYPWFVKRNIRR